MNELLRIVERTREELQERRRRTPVAALEAAAEARAGRGERRDFAAALRAPGLSVIAEHKRRSPSAGAIREDLELPQVVGAYERAGARALSVLTEPFSFGGTLADLGLARESSTLPILRKDFIVDAYQVTEAAAAGADAVLLIVATLNDDELAGLAEEAARRELDVLVEVHDHAELERASSIRNAIIGVNNRDLTTLRVDTRRTLELLPHLPPDAVSVAESGFSRPEQLRELAANGIDAVLVGEALMRSGDLEAACRELVQAGRP